MTCTELYKTNKSSGVTSEPEFDCWIDSQMLMLLFLLFSGGDNVYKSQFHINKTSGELWLGPSIDREVTDEVELIVKATHDCSSGNAVM